MKQNKNLISIIEYIIALAISSSVFIISLAAIVAGVNTLLSLDEINSVVGASLTIKIRDIIIGIAIFSLLVITTGYSLVQTILALKTESKIDIAKHKIKIHKSLYIVYITAFLIVIIENFELITCVSAIIIVINMILIHYKFIKIQLKEIKEGGLIETE